MTATANFGHHEDSSTGGVYVNDTGIELKVGRAASSKQIKHHVLGQGEN